MPILLRILFFIKQRSAVTRILWMIVCTALFLLFVLPSWKYDEKKTVFTVESLENEDIGFTGHVKVTGVYLYGESFVEVVSQKLLRPERKKKKSVIYPVFSHQQVTDALHSADSRMTCKLLIEDNDTTGNNMLNKYLRSDSFTVQGSLMGEPNEETISLLKKSGIRLDKKCMLLSLSGPPMPPKSSWKFFIFILLVFLLLAFSFLPERKLLGIYNLPSKIKAPSEKELTSYSANN